jgi:hypothetical protein
MCLDGKKEEMSRESKLVTWSKLQSKHRPGGERWNSSAFISSDSFEIGDRKWQWSMGELWKYVYVLTDGEAFKIGMSSKPNVRLDKMQTDNSKPVKHVVIFAVSQHVARDIERALHMHFAHENIRGEWFNGPDVKKWVEVHQKVS